MLDVSFYHKLSSASLTDWRTNSRFKTTNRREWAQNNSLFFIRWYLIPKQKCFYFHFSDSTPPFLNLPAIISFSCLPPDDKINAFGHQPLPKKWNLPLCGGDCRRVPSTRTHSFPACFFLSFFCRCHALRSRINPKRLLLALQLDYSLVVPLFPPAAKKIERGKEKKRKI